MADMDEGEMTESKTTPECTCPLPYKVMKPEQHTDTCPVVSAQFDSSTTLPGIDPTLQSVCDSGWNAAIDEAEQIAQRNSLSGCETGGEIYIAAKIAKEIGRLRRPT